MAEVLTPDSTQPVRWELERDPVTGAFTMRGTWRVTTAGVVSQFTTTTTPSLGADPNPTTEAIMNAHKTQLNTQVAALGE